MQYPSKDLYNTDDEDMDYKEFSTLLAGIMPDTPLGQIVSIRSEKDEKVIENYTSEQREIYNKWQQRLAQDVDEEEYLQRVTDLQKALANAFS